VRDVDRRGEQVALDACDLGPHLHPELRVQVREGLVHEEHAGVADDRPAHGDPLALPPGQLARLALEEIGDAENARDLGDARPDLRLLGSPHLQTEPDVVRDRHVRIQRVVLEHHRHVALARLELVHRTVADRDRPAADLLEAGDHAEHRRLTAAGRADEHDELAVRDLEIERAHGVRVVCVDLFDVRQGHGRHRRTELTTVSVRLFDFLRPQ
jgi:hypothetical protein